MTTMKAVIYSHYGPPDVLKFTETEKPVPKNNEALIKVIAASANPADWHMIRGKPYFARFTSGLFKPKYPIPGIDIAGVVEAVGSDVKAFKPNDEVFGDCGWGSGFAEYTCIPEEKIVAKPSNASFEEASTLNVAAITALQGLRFKGNPGAGQKILINGASGGVGTFAVQIAKTYGVEVTGVCSGKNAGLVVSIGADHVIDYQKEDFTKSNQKYDLILDAIGNRTVSDLKRALSDKGKCIIAGFTSLGLLFQHMVMGPLNSKSGGKFIGSMGTAMPNKKDLITLRDLVESRKVKPVIDRTYPLSKTAEAIRYLETGRARGKVVIKM